MPMADARAHERGGEVIPHAPDAVREKFLLRAGIAAPRRAFRTCRYKSQGARTHPRYAPTLEWPHPNDGAFR